MQISAAAYSFLHDPDVPAFDPPAYFAVMCAQCGLCAFPAPELEARIRR